MEFANKEEQRVWESFRSSRGKAPTPSTRPPTEQPIKPLGHGAALAVREWRVELLAAVGAVVLLAAEKGSGKTALCMRLAAAVSSGTPFLDQLQTTQGRVLYVQADECEAVTEVRRRLMGLPEGAYSVRYCEGLIDQHWLIGQIKTGAYDLVVIDSATSGLASEGSEVHDPAFVRSLYRIHRACSASRVTAVITTHLTKPFQAQSRQVVSAPDIAGMATIGNAIDDLWGLIRVPGKSETFRLNCLGKRNCRLDTVWTLTGCEEDFSFSLDNVDGDQMPATRRELRQKILDHLGALEEWQQPDAIAAAVGSTYEVVRRYCSELFGEDLIARQRGSIEGRGRPPWLYAQKETV